MSEPIDIEAIRKRNHDMWWRLNGHGVACWLQGQKQTDFVFRETAEDIDALIAEIERLREQLATPYWEQR